MPTFASSCIIATFEGSKSLHISSTWIGVGLIVRTTCSFVQRAVQRETERDLRRETVYCSPACDCWKGSLPSKGGIRVHACFWLRLEGLEVGVQSQGP